MFWQTQTVHVTTVETQDIQSLWNSRARHYSQPLPCPWPQRPPTCISSPSWPFHDYCVEGTAAFGIWLPLAGVVHSPRSPVLSVTIASVMNSWKPTQYIVKGSLLGVRGLRFESPFPAACSHSLTRGKSGPQFPVQETWGWVGVLGGSLAKPQGFLGDSDN